MNLVGRECWVAEKKLTHGTVIAISGGVVEVMTDDSVKRCFSRSSAVFTHEEALRLCQDAVEYWVAEERKLCEELKEGKE